MPKILEGHTTFNPDEEEWNEKYQRLIDSETATFEQSLAQGIGISTLLGNFLAATKKYVKHIVDEYHLPEEKRTVPPIPMGPEVPPEERDELYIQNGLLFRFAVDNSGKFDEGE